MNIVSIIFIIFPLLHIQKMLPNFSNLASLTYQQCQEEHKQFHNHHQILRYTVQLLQTIKINNTQFHTDPRYQNNVELFNALVHQLSSNQRQKWAEHLLMTDNHINKNHPSYAKLTI